MNILTHTIQLGRCAVFASMAMLATVEAIAEPAGPDPRLMMFYDRCSASAEIRMLNMDEIFQCSRAYQTIKMSFLTSEELSSLPSAEPSVRAALFAKAYRALLVWRAEQELTSHGM